jgi:uncharacterized protein YndB with AHSA1/START domain
MSKLTLTTEGETHVVVKRRFEAPPEAVYRAHLDPKLIQQWCLGPEGWTMHGTGTLMTMRMSLPDAETRKGMLATGMEHGMEASYARLERLSGWRLAS